MAKIDDLNQQIKELSAQLKQNPLKFDTKDIEAASNYVKSLESNLREVNSELSYVRDAFKDSVNELSKGNNYLNESKKALRGISSISQKLVSIKEGETKATTDQIKKLQTEAKLKFQMLQTALKMGDLQPKEKLEIEKSILAQKEFIIGAQEVLDIQKDINKNAGVRLFGGLGDIAKAIPGLNKFTGAFQGAAEAAESQARFNRLNADTLKMTTPKEIEKIKNYHKLRKAGIGASEAVKKSGANMALITAQGKGATLGISALAAGFKVLVARLKIILGPITLLVEVFKAFTAVDKQTSQLAKNMNMTYYEALAVRGELMAFASASNDTFLNTRALQESLLSINKSLGTSVMFADQDVAAFTKLREQAGLTNEEIMGTYKLSLLNGKSLEGNTSEFLAQAKITAYNNGVLVNEKELLKDISKTSAATQLSLGGSAKALGDALATAKSLGMTMDQIESSSEALLNFESSITNELKAELLLGKNINLERARLAALNNEFSVVAEEISNQIGDSADFSEMNRIQQEAIAKSVGMTRNSLAQTLMEREALVGLSGKEQELGQETLRGLIAQHGVAGAQRKLEEDGIENLMNQASKQEEFAAAVEKIQEVFVSMAPAIIGIMELLTGMLTIAELIVRPFTALAGALNKVHPILGGIVSLLGAAAIAAFIFKGILTPLQALGSLALIGGGIALVQAFLPKTTPVADMLYDPSRGPMVSNVPGGIYEGLPGEGAGIFPAKTAMNSNSNTSSPDPNLLAERKLEREERKREARETRDHQKRMEQKQDELISEARETNRGYLYSA